MGNFLNFFKLYSCNLVFGSIVKVFELLKNSFQWYKMNFSTDNPRNGFSDSFLIGRGIGINYCFNNCIHLLHPLMDSETINCSKKVLSLLLCFNCFFVSFFLYPLWLPQVSNQGLSHQCTCFSHVRRGALS